VFYSDLVYRYKTVAKFDENPSIANEVQYTPQCMFQAEADQSEDQQQQETERAESQVSVPKMIIH
jgi:hypothetical protein